MPLCLPACLSAQPALPASFCKECSCSGLSGPACPHLNPLFAAFFAALPGLPLPASPNSSPASRCLCCSPGSGQAAAGHPRMVRAGLAGPDGILLGGGPQSAAHLQVRLLSPRRLPCAAPRCLHVGSLLACRPEACCFDPCRCLLCPPVHPCFAAGSWPPTWSASATWRTELAPRMPALPTHAHLHNWRTQPPISRGLAASLFPMSRTLPLAEAFTRGRLSACLRKQRRQLRPHPAQPCFPSSFPISLLLPWLCPHEGACCTSSGAHPEPTRRRSQRSAARSIRLPIPDLCVGGSAAVRPCAPHTPPLVFSYFQASVTQAVEALGQSHLARLF
jgi:hypothetical protein